MNSAINFLLESGISLALLSTIYVFFLRRETFFRLNRIFLLLSVVFSVVLPFMKFRIYDAQPVMLSEITVTPYRNLMEAVTIYSHDFSGAVEKTISSSWMIILVYLAGLSFFLGRFILRLIQILLLIRKSPVRQNGTVKFVSVKKDFSPFSFLSFIFVNPEKSHEAGYDKMVAHEMEHIKQGHTFDVLILEILTVFQWFNPFMWMLKRAIRENHEYLADQAVLKSGITPVQYKLLLLNQVVGLQFEMANNFNSSLIKKRIKMITKIKSSKAANIKIILGVFVAIALVIAFACEQKETVDAKDGLVTQENQGITIAFSGETVIIKADENVKKSDIDRVKSILKAARVNHIKYIGNNSELDNMDNSGDTQIKKEGMPAPTMPNGDPIFFIVEEMPEFPGGELALRKNIAESVNYPEIARENGIQGKVYVTFVVAKDGSVANARIARGVDPSLDKEALRVVSGLPTWKPGKQRGTEVNVAYTVPINFALQ